MKNIIVLIVMYLICSNLFAAVAEPITCKTSTLEIKTFPFKEVNKATVTVRELSSGEIIANFVAIDETDEYESDWPVLKGNAVIEFSFFALERGTPRNFILAGKDLTLEANCNW